VDYEQVVQADLFHFGDPPVRLIYENDGLELVEIFRQVNARGTLTSLDLAFPDPSSPAGQVDWRSIFHKVLPYVDIFLPSIEELLFCLDRPQYNKLTWQDNNLLDQVTPELLHALSSELLTMGAKIVVLKLGERGLYLRTADDLHTLGHGIQDNLWSGRELWVPFFQVDVIGTTGSGDATIAGFISGMLRGLYPCETMTIAIAVGDCNIEAADALSGILAWDETRARVQNGWKRCELHISVLGWCYQPELHGWAGSADAENLLAKEI
jgi:sugar/nucleoside kinase (ribokinase family)